MAIVRVEFARTMRDVPPVGSWDLYTSAYFETAGSAPSLAVRNLIQRLFQGMPSTGASNILFQSLIVTGVGGARFRSWTWTAGSLVFLASATDTSVYTLATGNPTDWAMPMNITIPVNYQAEVAGPRQRGVSRFWIPGIWIKATAKTDTSSGTRLTSAAVTSLANQARDCIDALEALGWTLQVKSGPLATATFAKATEVSVGDVFGVMRSRSAWELYRTRNVI